MEIKIIRSCITESSYKIPIQTTIEKVEKDFNSRLNDIYISEFELIESSIKLNISKTPTNNFDVVELSAVAVKRNSFA